MCRKQVVQPYATLSTIYVLENMCLETYVLFQNVGFLLLSGLMRLLDKDEYRGKDSLEGQWYFCSSEQYNALF